VHVGEINERKKRRVARPTDRDWKEVSREPLGNEEGEKDMRKRIKKTLEKRPV